MPRRDDERDDDIEETTPTRRGVPAWVLVVAGLVLLGVVAVGGAAVLGMAVAKARQTIPSDAQTRSYEGETTPVVTTAAGTSDQPPKKTSTRKELAIWLTGKTKDDAKKYLGLPDSTTEDANYVTYVYKGVTVDADGSGKVDSAVVLRFAVPYKYTFVGPPTYIP